MPPLQESRRLARCLARGRAPSHCREDPSPAWRALTQSRDTRCSILRYVSCIFQSYKGSLKLTVREMCSCKCGLRAHSTRGLQAMSNNEVPVQSQSQEQGRGSQRENYPAGRSIQVPDSAGKEDEQGAAGRGERSVPGRLSFQPFAPSFRPFTFSFWPFPLDTASSPRAAWIGRRCGHPGYRCPFPATWIPGVHAVFPHHFSLWPQSWPQSIIAFVHLHPPPRFNAAAPSRRNHRFCCCR